MCDVGDCWKSPTLVVEGNGPNLNSGGPLPVGLAFGM